MSLLPSNALRKDQQFALLIDEKSKVDYSDLNVNPLICDSSLLSHIALQKGANIDYLSEKETRQYLNTFNKKANGTVGAVEDAINVFFQNAKLIEWFKDTELKKGTFRVDMTIKADNTMLYDQRTFTLLNRLINQSKNKRTKLAGYKISFPPVVAEVKVSSANDPLKVHPFMSINDLIVSEDISLQGGYFHDTDIKGGINEIINSEDINLKGGYRWQLEA